MKQLHIFIFYISLITGFTGFAQTETDTVKVKQKYGIRVGVDLSKPIISMLDKNQKGLELIGDFRFSKNYFAAAEVGYEDYTGTEDFLSYTAKGSYIKLGVNYNAYKNWKGMNNEIIVGFRYGFSTFTQTLNSYTPNVYGTYFIPDEVLINNKFDNLNAHWAELVLGMKVETFKNLFLGVSMSFKKMINMKEPDNFKNLYIPGFNRVYDNNAGFGFNYSLSYLIPIIKKKN